MQGMVERTIDRHKVCRFATLPRTLQESSAMKLNDQQTEAVERQTGLAPVPEDNPTVEMLKDNFGDHTFYVDKVGLYFWEPVDGDADDEAADGQADGGRKAAAVLLAAWADEERTAMRRTEPTVTDVVIDLDVAA
jgi:hypothetical protein